MLYKFEGRSPKALHQPWDGWVADNATVIGQAEFGQKVSVWFGAVIRADNAKIKLGDYTNVQENAVLHTDAGIEMQIGKQKITGRGIEGGKVTVHSHHSQKRIFDAFRCFAAHFCS